MSDYTELVEALRYCADSGGMVNCNTICEYGWRDSHGCKNLLMTDAAAAIEALQAQLPKRGKWVGVSPAVDTVQCSVCGGQLFSEELETPYCPYCGAKMMEVQDGK